LLLSTFPVSVTHPDVSWLRNLPSDAHPKISPSISPSTIEQTFIDSHGGDTRLFEIGQEIRRIRVGLRQENLG
jgi:hypothetical protein